ncbi:MAG: hypothetical protein ACRDCB_11270 [Clostridium sp.]|uniref:hypothetical protein n=1 Tax=Clostridium TaxID=1485 RepID=UPI0021534A7D|nr:hypothetical protein [Clostridium sp. LY3-2]MCR6515216.1 hypothetical protein [Clostridium sp. LY3-2]
MVKGIILITAGIVGMIASLVVLVKYMKKNNFILKGDYKEFKSEKVIHPKEESKNDHIEIDEENYDTELLEQEEYDTELLD